MASSRRQGRPPASPTRPGSKRGPRAAVPKRSSPTREEAGNEEKRRRHTDEEALKAATLSLARTEWRQATGHDWTDWDAAVLSSLRRSEQEEDAIRVAAALHRALLAAYDFYHRCYPSTPEYGVVFGNQCAPMLRRAIEQYLPFLVEQSEEQPYQLKRSDTHPAIEVSIQELRPIDVFGTIRLPPPPRVEDAGLIGQLLDEEWMWSRLAAGSDRLSLTCSAVPPPDIRARLGACAMILLGHWPDLRSPRLDKDGAQIGHTARAVIKIVAGTVREARRRQREKKEYKRGPQRRGNRP